MGMRETFSIQRIIFDRNNLSSKVSTIRKCKNIRDRVFDREQLANAIFKREVLELVSPESNVLDLGCGCTASFLRSLSSCFRKGYGVDLEVSETIIDGNIQIMRGDAEEIPLPDSSVDVAILMSVVEHLRNPERVFLECKRVLKPGGGILLMAPNKLYPPILVGRAFPHRFRQWVNMAITGTPMDVTFPAYYRANSVRALQHIASITGLRVARVRFLPDHPRYFMFSTLIYRFAAAIELRVLQRDAFRRFRARIFCHLINPE